ncbi:MAG: pimeloyl-ACP methyl ester carboxylesterase [Planctomycetota bacterium]|jgi:pimeloyl-ACP methyl ester carboxylesterase
MPSVGLIAIESMSQSHSPENAKRRRLRPLLIRLFMVGALGYGVGSYWLSSVLLELQERVVSKAGVPGLERSIRATADGTAISIWSGEPAGKSKGCVLLFHSRGSAHSVERMLWLRKQGFSVFAPDFRAHGESTGEISTFGWKEQEEVRLTLALARSMHPDLPVAAWGRSLGSAAILFATPETSELDGVILESTYSTLERAFANRFKRYFPNWLFPLTIGPIYVAEWRAGFDVDQIQPIQQLQHFRPERVLLVRGELDWRIHADEHVNMLAALPGATGLVLHGAGHDELFESGGEDYRDHLLSHLNRWLHGE